MINVEIDEYTPYLKQMKTGQLVQTEVVRIRRKSFLRAYNLKTAGMLIGPILPTKMRFMRLLLKAALMSRALLLSGRMKRPYRRL